MGKFRLQRLNLPENRPHYGLFFSKPHLITAQLHVYDFTADQPAQAQAFFTIHSVMHTESNP